MDFTVEGKVFQACGVEAQVLAVAPWQASARDQDIALGGGGSLRMPRGRKQWQCAVVRLENGAEAQLPLPDSCPVAVGDSLKLGCLGPASTTAGGDGTALEVYAVSNQTPGWKHDFSDAAALMKSYGVNRVSEYEVEPYPLKKVCKVSIIVFLVGLVCFSFLMHLFTESMDELVRRLPEALYMSAKFGGIAALVMAAGGGLYMKSSNDYNRKKKLDSYVQQFEQAMSEAMPQASV